MSADAPADDGRLCAASKCPPTRSRGPYAAAQLGGRRRSLLGSHPVSARENAINPRFVCDLEAVVEVIGRQTVRGLVRDISGSGLCVLTDIPVPAGSETNVHLRLILDWAESETLTLPARTLWLTRTSGHFQVGAAFGQMTVERWQRLEVLLRFLLGEIALEPAR